MRWFLTTVTIAAIQALHSAVEGKTGGVTVVSCPASCGCQPVAVVLCLNSSLIAPPASIPASATEVRFTNTSLVSIQSQAFVGYTGVTLLAITKHLSLSFQGGAFSGLSKLKKLYLNDNGIRVIPGDLFRPLDSLLQLSLHDNSLAELPVATFRGLGNLQTLLIYNNGLTTNGACCLLNVSQWANVSADPSVHTQLTKITSSCPDATPQCYYNEDKRQKLYFCQCPGNMVYNGSGCDDRARCNPHHASSACSQFPVCLPDEQTQYYCACEPGFTISGHTCSQNLSKSAHWAFGWIGSACFVLLAMLVVIALTCKGKTINKKLPRLPSSQPMGMSMSISMRGMGPELRRIESTGSGTFDPMRRYSATTAETPLSPCAGGTQYSTPGADVQYTPTQGRGTPTQTEYTSLGGHSGGYPLSTHTQVEVHVQESSDIYDTPETQSNKPAATTEEIGEGMVRHWACSDTGEITMELRRQISVDPKFRSLSVKQRETVLRKISVDPQFTALSEEEKGDALRKMVSGEQGPLTALHQQISAEFSGSYTNVPDFGLDDISSIPPERSASLRESAEPKNSGEWV